MEEDKRKYKRVGFESYTQTRSVIYKGKTVVLPKPLDIVFLDISEGGAKIKTHIKFPKDIILYLNICVDVGNIYKACEIAWCKYEELDYYYGLKFLTSQASEKIRGYIDDKKFGEND